MYVCSKKIYKIGKRKQRCGTCDACSKDDCAECVNCKDMVKFGGTGKKKKCCVQRQCENIQTKREKSRPQVHHVSDVECVVTVFTNVDLTQ